MFNKVDSDIYIMVAGDDTYDLAEVNRMISMVINDEADMVVGNRHETYTDKSFRPFHTSGNKLVKNLINELFRSNLRILCLGLE